MGRTVAFDFADEDFEHRLLRESIGNFFVRSLPPHEVRECDSQRVIPRETWRALAGLGLMALSIPEDYSGAGAPLATAAVAVEELAKGFPSLAADYVLVAMTSKLLSEHGSESQKSAMLPNLASGESLVAFAITEPSGGTDVLNISTTATLGDHGWTIHGKKLYTSLADEADHIIVLARTDGSADSRSVGLTLLIVPRNQSGIEVRRLQLMAMRAAATCEVFFDAARAPTEGIIGQRGHGFRHLLETLIDERILSAALSLGIGRGAFEHALRYALEREAFGRSIGGYQAIQHYLADTAIDLEQAQLLVRKSLSLRESGRDCSVVAAMAKVASAEACIRATDRGMRILAAYGLVEEGPMERYFRDARLQVFSPVSNEMARCFIGEKLGLPKSY